MRKLIIFTAVAAHLALAGCTDSGARTGLETTHQPVVARTNYVIDLPAGLTSADRARAAGWLKALNASYGDRVSIEDPSRNSGNRADIEALIGYYGLSLDEAAPVTEGPVPPGMFRVVLSRTVASVPGCPDWRQADALGFNNAQHSNFGCGVNSTFAAMVADPVDLVTGKDKPPAGYNQPNSRRQRDIAGAK